MSDPNSAEKKRLRMTRYKVDEKGMTILDSAIDFTVQLNPADVKHERSISYSPTENLGEAHRNFKFNKVGAEKVSFSLVLDSTGAVPMAPNTQLEDVKTQLDRLTQVVYEYVGTQHQPGHVRLLWGALIFYGRMETMSTTYTLFKPSGYPLRAKVALSFVEAVSKAESELLSNRSSPDLTHLIEVRDGDTLPLLCKSIYGDPGYYLDIARFNNLPDFRNLKPGRKLYFPPLS